MIFPEQEVICEEHKAFAIESYLHLSRVMESVSDEDGYFNKLDVASLKEDLLETVRDALKDGLRKNGKFAAITFNLFSTVRKGLDNGGIEVITAGDIISLTNVFDRSFSSSCYASEYYAKTGQLLDFLTMIRREDYSAAPTRLQRALFSTLYSYEMAMVLQYLVDGEDPEPFMGLPLEVKMVFADLSIDMELFEVLDRQKNRFNHREIFSVYSYQMPWLGLDDRVEAPSSLGSERSC